MTLATNTFEGIESIPLAEFVERAYLDYSMYVVLDRALPNIADGLKPVQRRIVYAMSELGLSALAKYKKSARTVGDVLGKFHPHGDSACYEAMVLMAQPFSYRYPLVDGQGNWGSQDDPKSFAAMRYTESRLAAYAEILLAELAQGTVEWVPNFDGTMDEPAILPARLPNVLLNGTSGIAVGMATDIPPHNLVEVTQALLHLLEHPKATITELMQYVPAPDFPTGGELITPMTELRTIYEKGQGSVRLRATYMEEDNQIVITALPHQVSGARVIEQIAEQMLAKKLPMVVDVRDEGDHEIPIRIVLELKSNRIDKEALMLHLFATTNLEHVIRINLNMIGINGRPQVKGLGQILREWLEFRLHTLRRRLEFRLNKLVERLHLLDGLLIAYLNLDEVIAIIRTEDDPKAKLIARFVLSVVQADAILDTKLRHLAKLEEQKIRTELAALKKEQAELEAILKSPARLKRLLRDELIELQKRFGDVRRTKIVERTAAVALTETEVSSSEPVTIILSEKGWVRMAKGHDIDADKLSYRAGDQLRMEAQGRSHDPAVFFDSHGRAYTLVASGLPSARGQGEPLSGKLTVNSGAEFVGVVLAPVGKHVLMTQDSGYGFFTPINELVSKNRSGKAVMKVATNAKMLTPQLIDDLQSFVAALSKQGYLLIFPLADLPMLPRGKGNKIMQLPSSGRKAGDALVQVVVLQAEDSLQLFAGSQKLLLKPSDWRHYLGERARRGQMLPRGVRQCQRMVVLPFTH